mgnify:CR=1 FL=1
MMLQLDPRNWSMRDGSGTEEQQLGLFLLVTLASLEHLLLSLRSVTKRVRAAHLHEYVAIVFVSFSSRCGDCVGRQFFRVLELGSACKQVRCFTTQINQTASCFCWFAALDRAERAAATGIAAVNLLMRGEIADSPASTRGT